MPRIPKHLVLIPALFIAASSLEAQPTTLHVNGQGMVLAEPDRSRITLAVETEAPSAVAASQENAERMTAVMGAIRALGLSGIEMETSGYQVTPVYAPAQPGTAATVAAYRVRNQIVIRSVGVEGVGRITDAGLAAGANRVQGISFEVSDPTPHRREALRLAVSEARAEAEVMARALGMRLGPLQRVEGGADPVFAPPRIQVSEMMRMGAVADTPIEAGGLSFAARASLIFTAYPLDADGGEED
jgi:uncharacterized protein